MVVKHTCFTIIIGLLLFFRLSCKAEVVKNEKLNDETGQHVQLYIFDLSKGTAVTVSKFLLENPIDAIYHTSIVVFGREFYFGRDGVIEGEPGKTWFGEPAKIQLLGITNVTESEFRTFLENNLKKQKYAAGVYKLFSHNCNTFTNELSKYLIGNGIPQYILELQLAIQVPKNKSRPLNSQKNSKKQIAKNSTKIVGRNQSRGEKSENLFKKRSNNLSRNGKIEPKTDEVNEIVTNEENTDEKTSQNNSSTLQNITETGKELIKKTVSNINKNLPDLKNSNESLKKVTETISSKLLRKQSKNEERQKNLKNISKGMINKRTKNNNGASGRNLSKNSNDVQEENQDKKNEETAENLSNFESEENNSSGKASNDNSCKKITGAENELSEKTRMNNKTQIRKKIDIRPVKKKSDKNEEKLENMSNVGTDANNFTGIESDNNNTNNTNSKIVNKSRMNIKIDNEPVKKNLAKMKKENVIPKNRNKMKKADSKKLTKDLS